MLTTVLAGGLDHVPSWVLTLAKLALGVLVFYCILEFCLSGGRNGRD